VTCGKLTSARIGSSLSNDCVEVFPIIVGDFGGKSLYLFRSDEAHTICNFLETGDFQSLA
jgi:hypothetical protein